MFLMGTRHKPQTPMLMALVYDMIDRLLDYPSVDWAGRLHAYEKVFAGSCDDWPKDLTGEKTAQTEPAEKTETPPPLHQPGDYEGSYVHPAYGKMEIRTSSVKEACFTMPALQQQEPEDTGSFASGFGSTCLELHYKQWWLPLEHADGDCFVVRNLKEDTLYYTVPLHFLTDEQTGKIQGFTLKLEETVPPMRFARDEER